MDENYTDDVLLTVEEDTLFENEVIMGDESLRFVDNLLRSSFDKFKELE